MPTNSYNASYVYAYVLHNIISTFSLTVRNRILLMIVVGQREPGMWQRDLRRCPLNGGVHYQLIERIEPEKPLMYGYPVFGSRKSHFGSVVYHSSYTLS